MNHRTISYLNQNHSFGKNIVLHIVIYFMSNNKLTVDFNVICFTLLNSHPTPQKEEEKKSKERKKRRKSWRPEWDLNPVLKCKHTLSCSEQKREKAHMRKPQSCKLQYIQSEGRFGYISLMGQTASC